MQIIIIVFDVLGFEVKVQEEEYDFVDDDIIIGCLLSVL